MATIDDVAMQVTGVTEKLAAHERIMQDRYEHLEHGLKKVKSAVSAVKEDEMAGTVNVENPMGGILPLLMNQGGSGTAGAAGLGAGALGFVAGTLVGNRGGLFGGGNNVDVGGGFVTPNQLHTAVNTITGNNDTTTIQQTLGDIKASIPLAEGQVQLALQNAQADINRNIDNTGDQITAQVSAAQLNNANNFAAQSRQISDILASSIANQNSIRSDLNLGVASINAGIANLATAGLQNTYALNTAIRDASDKAVAATNAQGLETRALINSLNTQNLERSLSDANNKINMLELAAQNNGIQRQVRETEINITNQNSATAAANANANAIATIVQTLNQIVPVLNGLQHATAANTQIIAGNRGYAQGGAQSAVPTNVIA